MPNANFSFREGEPIRLKNAKEANPDVIGVALSEIAAKNGGQIEPQNVVDAAADVRHPLHRFFEWNDAKAANAHRLDQARALIRIVRVEVPEAAEPVRAFFSIKDGAGQRYRPVGTILNSASMQLALLKAAKRDLEAFRERYRSIDVLFADMSAAMEKIDKRLAEVGARAAA